MVHRGQIKQMLHLRKEDSTATSTEEGWGAPKSRLRLQTGPLSSTRYISHITGSTT